MFRRPRPNELEERPVFTKRERVGAAIAHAAPLFFGVPLFPLLGNVGFALLPSPIIAYVISRVFRNQQSTWGAFQGMQATLVHLALVVLVFVAYFTGVGCRIRSGAVPGNPGGFCRRLPALPLLPLGRVGYGMGLRLPLYLHQQFCGQDYLRQPSSPGPAPSTPRSPKSQ